LSGIFDQDGEPRQDDNNDHRDCRSAHGSQQRWIGQGLSHATDEFVLSFEVVCGLLQRSLEPSSALTGPNHPENGPRHSWRAGLQALS
jgi:hypothetical protein